jgi:mannose/fructose/N-acetylgalactosamine-specific phosphotransferase system component IIB
MNMKKNIKTHMKDYTKRLMLYVVDKEPLEVMESTPSEIKRAISRLSVKQMKQSPAKKKWSITEILAHLADGEIVLGYRLRKIIAEPGSKIESYDQNKWAKNLNYHKADAKERFTMFSAVRKANVQMLKSLQPNAWKRHGIHQERGRETVERLVLIYAGHDMNHLKQIQNIAGKFRG